MASRARRDTPYAPLVGHRCSSLAPLSLSLSLCLSRSPLTLPLVHSFSLAPFRSLTLSSSFLAPIFHARSVFTPSARVSPEKAEDTMNLARTRLRLTTQHTHAQPRSLAPSHATPHLFLPVLSVHDTVALRWRHRKRRGRAAASGKFHSGGDATPAHLGSTRSRGTRESCACDGDSSQRFISLSLARARARAHAPSGTRRSSRRNVAARSRRRVGISRSNAAPRRRRRAPSIFRCDATCRLFRPRGCRAGTPKRSYLSRLIRVADKAQLETDDLTEVTGKF